MYDICDYGEGRGLATVAIQAAIDACHDAGGGTVLVPAGKYESATIKLKSHVHLHLEAGAVLAATKDQLLYPAVESAENSNAFLITAENAEDIGIHGNGTVLGTGQETLGWYWGVGDYPKFRIGLLFFHGCRDIAIDGVCFRESDMWTLHFKKCENLLIDRVSIRNNFHHINSDGIDPNSCRNVIISNCNIITGDDCIVAKATQDHPCENLVVTNCLLESPTTAIKLGTESFGDFRDVHISNCVIRNSSGGLGIYMKDGGTVERVTFSNISIECADRDHIRPVLPLMIDIERRNKDSKAGRIRDVIFSNIQIESGTGCLFQGLEESPVENITLKDISFRVPRAADYSKRKKPKGGVADKNEFDTVYIQRPAYAAFANVDGLVVERFGVNDDGQGFTEDRFAISCDNVQNSSLNHVCMNGRDGSVYNP